jgi:hypothetical protein
MPFFLLGGLLLTHGKMKNRMILSKFKTSKLQLGSRTSTKIDIQSKDFLLNEYVKKMQVMLAKQEETCCLLQSKHDRQR